MIDEAPQRRMTRAEQRVATRTTILDAAGECLIQDGYAALTTRRVAERAKVAQSTLMHHFPTREALLVETVSQLAMQVADATLDDLDLTAVDGPEQREFLLDQVWSAFTTPQALAAAQLWFASWSEPELAAELRELEERLTAILMAAATAVVPDFVDDPAFPALVDTGASVIRGLVMAIPVSGREAVEARWQAIRPILSAAAADLLDRPASERHRPAA